MTGKSKCDCGSWWTRHGLAAVFGLIWPPVAAAVAYGVLLVAAIAFGKNPGGPLALPGMVIMGLVYAAWAVFAVSWPSVAIAEILVKADGFKPALMRLGTAILLGVLLALPWAAWAAGMAAEEFHATTFRTACLLAGSVLPAIIIHWFIARTLRTVFAAGRGFSTVVARRWPGPGSGAD